MAHAAFFLYLQAGVRIWLLKVYGDLEVVHRLHAAPVKRIAQVQNELGRCRGRRVHHGRGDCNTGDAGNRCMSKHVDELQYFLNGAVFSCTGLI
jgi:hypothetical protein